MMASTVLNPRQHVGLQRLAELAEVVHSSLGPNKRYKFIQDDASGESALACSCFRILESLDLTCAVSQLVYETVRAQQKVYKTGSGCLLFLAGAWSRAAVECVRRGIPVSRVVSAMSEALDVCAEVCGKCSIMIEGLGAAHSATCTATSPPDSGRRTSSNLPPGTTSVGPHLRGHRKLKLSRHFCETENVPEETQPPQSKPLNIAHIAEGLSHGCADVMNLVMEVNKVQSRDVSCSTLDVSKVMTCVVPGLAEERARVLPGCVFLLPAVQDSIARHLKEQQLKFVLIHGDLSHTFRHLGFSRPAGLQHVSDQPALSSDKEEEEGWLAKVVALLLNLGVNLVLVSGLASEKVIQHCCRHRVLVVEKVKPSVLRAFAHATGCVPVSYATQLTKHCVGAGTKVEIREDLGGGGAERKRLTAVNVSTGGASGGLVTVMLTSFVQGKLQALEDQFWACAYRLDRALTDRAVLPGAGATEMICIQRLLQRAENCGAAHLDRGVVWRLMAEGFIDYVSTVMVNTGRFSKVKARTAVSQHLWGDDGHGEAAAKFAARSLLSEGGNDDDAALATVVYDNLSVKQEAWRKALDLVLLLLQTDAEVITGMDPKTAQQQNLILL